jgi:hypothetical protein
VEEYIETHTLASSAKAKWACKPGVEGGRQRLVEELEAVRNAMSDARKGGSKRDPGAFPIYCIRYYKDSCAQHLLYKYSVQRPEEVQQQVQYRGSGNP